MSFDDRIAVGFSRAVTRRLLLTRSMRAAAVAGTAVSTSFALPRRANATFRCGGRTWWPSGTSGCYCASTPFCGRSKCDHDNCVGGAKGRCDFWSDAPYCWCTKKCVLNNYGRIGFYSCCDCWKYGTYGKGCKTGDTPCICKHLHAAGIRSPHSTSAQSLGEDAWAILIDEGYDES